MIRVPTTARPLLEATAGDDGGIDYEAYCRGLLGLDDPDDPDLLAREL